MIPLQFSSGPLCAMSPLYGWDARTLSRPGEGTQSWLLSLRNPLARATHVAGAALDMVFISEECVTEYFCCSPRMVVALSAHLVAQRSDLITFYVTSLFLRYYKVSMFGMHRAQPILFQLSEIGNQYFLLPVQNLRSAPDLVGHNQADTPEAKLQCIADVSNHDGGLANVFRR